MSELKRWSPAARDEGAGRHGYMAGDKQGDWVFAHDAEKRIALLELQLAVSQDAERRMEVEIKLLWTALTNEVSVHRIKALSGAVLLARTSPSGMEAPRKKDEMSETTTAEIGGTFDCPVCGLSYIHTHELNRITSDDAPTRIVSDMLESRKREIRYLSERGGFEYENRCEAEIGQAERLYVLLSKLRLAE